MAVRCWLLSHSWWVRQSLWLPKGTCDPTPHSLLLTGPSLHHSLSPAKHAEKTQPPHHPNWIWAEIFKLKSYIKAQHKHLYSQQIKAFILAQTHLSDEGNRCSRATSTWESFAVFAYLWTIFIHTNTHPLPSLRVRKSPAPVKHG